MRTLSVTVFAAFLGSCSASCSAFKPPPSDGGTTAKDVEAKEAAACVQDFAACNAQSICCSGTFVCNPGSGLCEKACLGVGNICTTNGDCCSGICSGTCD